MCVQFEQRKALFKKLTSTYLMFLMYCRGVNYPKDKKNQFSI